MRRHLLAASFLLAAGPALALPPTVATPSIPLNSARVPAGNAGAATGAAVLDASGTLNTLLSATPSGAVNAIGMSQLLGSPYRQPTRFDDVSRGNFPSMVWRSSGDTWVNVSNGLNQAVWQKQQQFALPGDTIGLYVSAAALHSGGGGSGYVTGNTVTLQGGVVLTVTATSGAVTGVSAVTVPNMYGVCAPVTSAAPALATSGSGTGATFDLTVLYPTIYSVRRVSSCYSGSILRVQNSVTTQTKDVAYLADNSMDSAAAIAFGSGGAQMEGYANYNDGAVPGVSIWYDQGGNPTPNNATQTTIAQQPVIFAGRKFGNSVAVLFNSQGNSGAGNPYPSITSLAMPSSLTLNSANAAVMVGGGDVNNVTPFVALTPVSGTATSIFGLWDSSAYPICANQNTAGSGNANGNAAPVISESGAVYSCLWSGGTLQPDSTYYPAPYANYSINGFGSGSTQSITVNNGQFCGVTANHTLSLVAGASETYQAYTLRLIAAVNADSVFAAAGITARPSLINYGYILSLYQPVGSSCTFSTATVGSGGFGSTTNASGAGWNFAGGNLGSGVGSSSGNGYEGIVAVVPWAVAPAQAQRFRQSVNAAFQIDGHIGAIVSNLAASNLSGYLTPFLQDVPAEYSKLIGRDDLLVINKTGAGTSLVTFVQPNFQNFGMYNNPLVYFTSGKSSNNVGIIFGEYNSLTTTGSSTTEYNSIQTIGGYYHAAGWKTVCLAEIQKNVTAIQSSENNALQGLLSATPGTCDVVMNPLTVPAYAINFPGAWNWPIFTKSGTGSHVSAAGNSIIESMFAETLRGMLQ